MFVEEFCRFAGIETSGVEQLRVLERNRNSVGFITTLEARSVPAQLTYGTVFNSPRVVVVGPEQSLCGSLLLFDKRTGALDAIEGYVYGESWPKVETPFFWSESERVVSRQGRR